jgi:hypothetical protein
MYGMWIKTSRNCGKHKRTQMKEDSVSAVKETVELAARQLSYIT